MDAWRFIGRYVDGFEITVNETSEELCIQYLFDLAESHGGIEWYSGYEGDGYVAGKYIGSENFICD